MNFLQILLLAVIQGFCELLPVSSSAHVIIAAKLMGMPPMSSPPMTFLLVLLHTGTMFAVIVYFWNAWRQNYFSSSAAFIEIAELVIIATAVTGILGLGLKHVIEKVLAHGASKAEVELLFDNLNLIAGALLAVGIVIIAAGFLNAGRPGRSEIGVRDASLIGAIQGLCLPFRGFSRSGATISAGLLLGGARQKVEEFSFALAVVLTPPLIAMEALRLKKSLHALPTGESPSLGHLAAPGLVGMIFSFLAGLAALRLLSRWLEGGKWQYFGFYCVAASALAFYLASRGY